MNLFNNLSSRESQKTLNRKNAICLQSAKKLEARLGKKQHDLEEKVMACIGEMWSKKRRASRIIVFHKSSNIFLGSKVDHLAPRVFPM